MPSLCHRVTIARKRLDSRKANLCNHLRRKDTKETFSLRNCNLHHLDTQKILALHVVSDCRFCNQAQPSSDVTWSTSHNLPSYVSHQPACFAFAIRRSKDRPLNSIIRLSTSDLSKRLIWFDMVVQMMLRKPLSSSGVVV